MEDGTPPPPPPRVTRTSSLISEDSVVRESMCTEWTDEKHSLYLKSMEATFVNQLYDSFDSLGWHSQREHSPDPKFPGKKHANNRCASGQYKVLRGGCWGKINFERHERQLDKADGSGVLLANPWIRHFRSTCRPQIVTSSTLQEKAGFGSQAVRVRGKMALTSAAFAANLKQFPARHSNVCHYDSVGSDTEVTDQNFVDEDIKAEKASHPCNPKRMKTSVVATSSNDQVVPFGEFPVTTDVTRNSFSPERERSCGSTGLKSENKDGVP